VAAAAVGSREPKKSLSGSVTVKPDTPMRSQRFQWVVVFGNIEIKDGTVHYSDETVQPAYAAQIVKCEVEILPKNELSSFHGTLRGMIWQAVQRSIEAEGDLDLVEQALNFKFRYDKDRADLKGVLKLVQNIPHFEGTLKIQGLDLETLVPEAYKKGEYLAGILDSDLKLSFDGANPDSILQSLDGDGRVGITNGSLRNRNLVREIMEKMSPVIAVAGLFGGQLPPEVGELMKGDNTDFKQAAVQFSAARGKVTIQEFYLDHPDYQLAGKGTYGLLSQKIDLAASLKFSQSITDYLVKKIHELEALCSPGGLLIIPFRYSGTIPDAAVTPDLQYIGSRLLQTSAQQLIDKGLKKLSKYLEPKS